MARCQSVKLLLHLCSCVGCCFTARSRDDEDGAERRADKAAADAAAAGGGEGAGAGDAATGAAGPGAEAAAEPVVRKAPVLGKSPTGEGPGARAVPGWRSRIKLYQLTAVDRGVALSGASQTFGIWHVAMPVAIIVRGGESKQGCLARPPGLEDAGQ